MDTGASGKGLEELADTAGSTPMPLSPSPSQGPAPSEHDLIEEELSKKKFIPRFMSRLYHGPAYWPAPVAALAESFAFSCTMPYVNASAFRRMREWRWDYGTPPLRTMGLGLGITSGTLLSVVPPILTLVAGFQYDDWRYAVGWGSFWAATNIGSVIWEMSEKRLRAKNGLPQRDGPGGWDKDTKYIDSP